MLAQPHDRADAADIQTLQLAARRDPLTGAANRIELESRLAQAMTAFSSDAAPFAVLFLDVDFFKRVNDDYGHSVGDEVLVALAKQIRQECDDSMLIARYGGDEFLVVCAEADLESAVRQGERIRLSIAQSSLCTTADMRATVSCGVAVVEPSDSVDSLLRRADKALYRAKRTGRNRTCALTSADLVERPDSATLNVDNDDPFVLRARFTVPITIETLLSALGRLLREQHARFTDIDRDHATLQIGRRRLFALGRPRNHNRPVEITFDFSELSTFRDENAPVTLQVTVRPLGRKRQADDFQSRASALVELLTSQFVADQERLANP
ncbi:MAG: GGDEF domain-containing protein [Planctomycetaceae bacterium]